MTDASTTTTTDQATATTGSGAQAQTTTTDQPWYSSIIDENLRTNPTIQRYATPQDLASAYVTLEKRFSIDPARRIDLPADSNDAEAMGAVWSKLGRPDAADKYSFKLNDKATDADKAFAGKFGDLAFKLGMPDNMAAGLVSFFEAETAAAAEAQTQAMNAAAEAGTTTLKKEWGQAYEPRLKEIGNLLVKYGDPDLAKALDEGGMGRNPNLALFLGKMLDRMAEPAGLLNGESQTPRAMTPDQAKASARAIEGDLVKGKALTDNKHPQHAAVVAERSRLLRIANGQKVD